MFDSLSNSELMIGESRLVHQQQHCVFDPGQHNKNTHISFSASTGRLYDLFLLFQLGSAAAFSSTGRSRGERESWGDF